MATPKKKPEERQKAGQPEKYKNEYCQTAIDMGRLGKTNVQIACALDVVTQTLQNWCENHAEFLVAMVKAKQLSEAFWTEAAQNASTTGRNYGMMRFYLSARFGWSEKTEVKNDITSQGEKLSLGPLVIAPASQVDDDQA